MVLHTMAVIGEDRRAGTRKVPCGMRVDVGLAWVRNRD